ncbi:MAG: hypothetical protein ABIN01_21030 [Ferruginibacter sp.]
MKEIISISLIAVFILAACQPEMWLEDEKQTTPGTLNDFVNRNRSSLEVYTVAVSTPGQLTTAKDTKIYFAANAFVDEQNKPVTGAVKIEVKEITTPGEMILNDMPTTSNGRLLESGGEYNIMVSQNGKKLKLAPGNFLKIGLPNAAYARMQVFNGVSDASGNVNWVPNNNPGNFVVGDSLYLRTELLCDSINWINCDRFINEPTVELSVYPGNVPSADSTNVFIHLTGKNAMVKMNWAQGLHYFNSKTVLAMPSSIIGISKKNGLTYISVIAVNVQNGQSVTLNFSPCTESELKAKLALLH